mmetsp:Transcript_47056/g.117372  ORF Transcript_47056/g.117372 Transcript_47056/m.117372 type:complete len:205 (+) Transcript_47056:1025-1639(+)
MGASGGQRTHHCAGVTTQQRPAERLPAAAGCLCRLPDGGQNLFLPRFGDWAAEGLPGGMSLSHARRPAVLSLADGIWGAGADIQVGSAVSGVRLPAERAAGRCVGFVLPERAAECRGGIPVRQECLLPAAAWRHAHQKGNSRFDSPGLHPSALCALPIRLLAPLPQPHGGIDPHRPAHPLAIGPLQRCSFPLLPGPFRLDHMCT